MQFKKSKLRRVFNKIETAFVNEPQEKNCEQFLNSQIDDLKSIIKSLLGHDDSGFFLPKQGQVVVQETKIPFIDIIQEFSCLKGKTETFELHGTFSKSFFDYFCQRPEITMDEVLDKASFSPLGSYLVDNENNLQPLEHPNVVDADLQILSSFFCIIIQSCMQFDSEKIMVDDDLFQRTDKLLEQLKLPIFNIFSLSTRLEYNSIQANGFCAYLTAYLTDTFRVENLRNFDDYKKVFYPKNVA